MHEVHTCAGLSKVLAGFVCSEQIVRASAGHAYILCTHHTIMHLVLMVFLLAVGIAAGMQASVKRVHACWCPEQCKQCLRRFYDCDMH